MKNLYGFVPGRLQEQGANALIENPAFLQLRQGSSSSKDAFGNPVSGKSAPTTPVASRTSSNTHLSTVTSTPATNASFPAASPGITWL